MHINLQKNIIAIAAGIADGLNLGENARAGLMVRGITEIARLGSALGADEKTFYGLSGIATVENNLFHAVAAQVFGTLFAKSPANCINNIAFAATVWTHHH